MYGSGFKGNGSKRGKLADRIREKSAAGYKVFCFVNGQPAPDNKQSNLYKALESAKKAGYTDIDYVIGAHRWNGADGFYMAVIVREGRK